MNMLQIEGVALDGICACVPAGVEESFSRLCALYGDEEKARSVVKATGISSRRVAAAGVSSLDLCTAAAERLFDSSAVRRDEIGSVVCVTFTPASAMPCNAVRAQSSLGLGTGVAAFDINMACSGWVYGLYVAALLAKSSGRKTLLLDGDVQTAHVDPSDGATVPVLADAGSATVVSPSPGARAWKFAFMSDGAKGGALVLPHGGRISMDGFGVFRFVTVDTLRFLGDFLAGTGETPESLDAFVPHQANIFMVSQLARSLGFPQEKLLTSAGEFGNTGSSSLPLTIACRCGKPGMPEKDARLLVSGFGGGLSAGAALVDLPARCRLEVFDYKDGEE